MKKLTTLDEVAGAFASDGRLAGWVAGRAAPDVLSTEREDSGRVTWLWPEVWGNRAQVARHLESARGSGGRVILVGTDEEFEASSVDEIGDSRSSLLLEPLPISPVRLAVLMRGLVGAAGLAGEATLKVQLGQAQHESNLLIDIGRALSQERDLGALLDLILARAREVTSADAGSIYVVEGDAEDLAQRTLRFTESQNDSREITSEGFTMAVSPDSIVGACVLSGEAINIPDLYALDAPGTGNNPWGFVHDRSWDEKHDYQTHSMLTIPMISAREQVIGVIQLINRRAPGVDRLDSSEALSRHVVPFDEGSVNFASTLASQAGIALENALLYDEVRTLFEGFVHASVIAIEARDPTTSGHSARVADLTVGLAVVADRSDSGAYADLSFTSDQIKQIEYAALLHDFGKVGVREHVLVKAKKLYEHERQLIESRFEFIRKSLEAETLGAKFERLMAADRAAVAEQLAAIDRDAEARLRELDDFLQFVLKANEPTVLEQGGFERIADIATRKYTTLDGTERNFLSPEEVVALQIARGSLTEEERQEIESHVVHTFNFLQKIPWGRTFRDIPVIAGAHHEKLDGTGYPNRLSSEQIPVPAKMMTISDIYDALTASDRPYKRAVPRQKALDILASDVERGKLDAELFQLFLDAKVWERVA